MKNIGKLFKGIGAVMTFCLTAGVIVSKVEKEKGWAEGRTPTGFYEREWKRPIDFGLSLMAVIFLWPLMIVIGIAVRRKLGTPVIFKQPRPGRIVSKTGKERIFNMYKFRTMTDERDINGELLPDEIRLGTFGKRLRATSLDELPEIFNILKGDMSLIGPRPQLVRDMVFMSEEQRMRHTVKPGLSGLAQIKGRNAISWEEKLEWDLEYIKKITFLGDLRIVLETVKKVFIRKNIAESSGEIDVTLDYGDYLLSCGRVSKARYDELQNQAKKLLGKRP